MKLSKNYSFELKIGIGAVVILVLVLGIGYRFRKNRLERIHALEESLPANQNFDQYRVLTQKTGPDGASVMIMTNLSPEQIESRRKSRAATLAKVKKEIAQRQREGIEQLRRDSKKRYTDVEIKKQVEAILRNPKLNSGYKQSALVDLQNQVMNSATPLEKKKQYYKSIDRQVASLGQPTLQLSQQEAQSPMPVPMPRKSQ